MDNSESIVDNKIIIYPGFLHLDSLPQPGKDIYKNKVWRIENENIELLDITRISTEILKLVLSVGYLYY